MNKFILYSIIFSLIVSSKLLAVEVRNTIISNDPKFTSSIAFEPLNLFANSSINALGTEVSASYIYKDIGSVHISGGTTYYSIRQKLMSEIEAENNFSGRRAFGEFSLMIFYNKINYIEENQVNLGSILTGNTVIDYQTRTDRKIKHFRGIRIGGLYEYSNINYTNKDAYDQDLKKDETEQGAQLFIGLSAWRISDIVFNLLDKELIDNFGKEHEDGFLSMYYLDVIVDPLNVPSLSSLGLRAGFKEETKYHLHYKIELGRSPILGFYLSLGIGIGSIF